MALAVNKRANFDYEILEKYEAGLVLTGHEVKSVRAGNANLRGAYITFRETKKGALPEDANFPPEYTICVECGEPYRGLEHPNLICPKCGGKLIDLKENYPENRIKEKLKRESFIKRIHENQEC